MAVVHKLGLACVFFLVAAVNASAEPRFVYTNDDVAGPNTVSVFRVRSDGTMTPAAESPYATGGTGAGGGFFAANRAVVYAARNLLFVSNTGSNDISVFRIDSTSGALTAVPGSPFPSGGTSTLGISLASTPDGRYLIASNSDSRNIVVFRVGPTGALSVTPGSPYALIDIPDGIKVSPNGRLLTVALVHANLIDVFSIGSRGELVRVQGAPFPAFRPAGLDINCTSSRLFAGEAASGTQVEVFTLSGRGQLAPVAGSPFVFASGSNGNVAVLNPADNLLFVSNQDTDSVTVLRAGASGALTLVPGSPFAVGGGAFYPSGMATDRMGKFLYVANFFDQVAVFRVQPDGSLTAVPGSPFRTGQNGGLLSLTSYPGKSCAVPVQVEMASGKVERIPSRRHGKLRVAVLGDKGLDLSTVDVRSVTFEGAPVVSTTLKQNGHGGRLILTFDAASVDMPQGSPAACVFGTLRSGRPFSGCIPVPIDEGSKAPAAR